VGSWGHEIFECDAEQDAVAEIAQQLIFSLEEDLEAAAEDGVLERPTLAYLALLQAIFKSIPVARVNVSAPKVRRWREAYLAWLHSTAREENPPEEWLQAREKHARREFRKLARLAQAPAEEDDPFFEGESGRSEESDDDGPRGPRVMTVDEAIEQYSSEAAEIRKEISVLGFEFNPFLRYGRLFSQYCQWGKVLWRFGESPVEPFRLAVAAKEEWVEGNADSSESTDLRWSKLQSTAIIEFLLGQSSVYERLRSLGPPEPPDDTYYIWECMDRCVVDNIYGEANPKRLRELINMYNQKHVQERYFNYADLIEAGRRGDLEIAVELAHRQAHLFEADRLSPDITPTMIDTGEGPPVLLDVDIYLAAILKAYNIPMPDDFVHAWRW
jgi:hypothetical protein